MAERGRVTTAAGANRQALRVQVTGLVQGVGFRPFVHRLAARHQLGGWIRNRGGDVEIAIEGPPERLSEFLFALEREPPPLARIAAVHTSADELRGDVEFRILPSSDQLEQRQPVSPDVALCAACEAELFDPANRRYLYPFITCTDCGPRYTVIEAMPYDRVRTSMRAFAQCEQCMREYRTAGDRRYHSETNSCAACGPRLWFSDSPAAPAAAGGATQSGITAPMGSDALDNAADCLLHGGILALRGLGGFHLAALADEPETVARLRDRKRRDAKPFAVMVRTIAEARTLAQVGPHEERALSSAERPIVLLRRRDNAPIAKGVSDGLSTIGVMLAYTPLHHLLLTRVGRPLIMTSGNLSEEPIATGNSEALERLALIADAFLMHDREIVARYDDSVVRVVTGAPLFLRRARGFAPLPVRLPWAAPAPILAVGPHLKNTFTLAHGDLAFVSQHIGDLENLETLEHFRAALDACRRLFRIKPAAVARDLHPGYLSSRVAEEEALPLVFAVQHHHAHVVAVAAEHGVTEPVIGLAFDGTGLGEDGNVWGSEFLVADAFGHQRLGHLRYAPLPGGDLAARRPWRAALGYASLDPDAGGAFALAFIGVDDTELRTAQRQIERALNAPLASSMGRLFDAAAAVLGVRTHAAYEGHAAMELESLAGERAAGPLPFPVLQQDDGWMLDPLPLLVALGEQRQRGKDVHELAAAFHESIASASAALVKHLRVRTGISTIALGGGTFQNRRLLESLTARLEAAGFRVLVPRLLPPNDGAISYGQAAIAAALLLEPAIGSSRRPTHAV